MNNKYVIEPMYDSLEEETSSEFIEWLESVLDEHLNEIWGVEEDLEGDKNSLNYHTTKHVLINKEKNGKIIYDIFNSDRPKIPNDFIIKSDKPYTFQFNEIANFYLSEAKYLVNETPVGDSKTQQARIRGFKVWYNNAPACIKLRIRSKYILPAENSPSGNQEILGNIYSDFTAYVLKEDGYVDVKTYFITKMNKIYKELGKFIGELTDKEKQPYGASNKSLLADVYYVDTNSKTIKKEVMNLDDAIKLYNVQNSNTTTVPDKLVFKIDGNIPEDRKIKYPSKNKRRMDYFNNVEMVYGVDLTGDAVAKVEEVAEGLEYKLSEEFINSFLKALGVDRVRGLDKELIEARLKDAVEFTNGDTTKGFDSETFKFLIESHTVISALHCLNEAN